MMASSTGFTVAHACQPTTDIDITLPTNRMVIYVRLAQFRLKYNRVFDVSMTIGWVMR